MIMNEKFEEIRNKIINEIEDRLEKIGPKEREALRERLWNMIQYAIGRHDYYEGYRLRYLTIATTLLTVSVAGLAFLVNAKIAGCSDLFFYLAFIILGITGGCLIYRFKKETSPNYPYRDVAKITSWYHYYNLPSDEKLLLNFKGKEIRQRLIQEYLKNLKEFTIRWIELNESEKLQEDLEQVFILFTLQAYKRAFVKKMAHNLQIGISLFIALIAIAGFTYIFPTICPLFIKLLNWFFSKINIFIR